ncbi:uncharacterized protein [Macrobrachium rosenbergii]|uniref:uncharacterized protein n=1 Tax=Macrobrachium rosenbergii TaxID=79674 RepID=UPI0034D3C832
MRTANPSLAVTVLVLVTALLVQEASPQSATVSINNQALFGLGAVLLASGVAYHVGRQSALGSGNQYRGGNRHFNNGFPFFGRRRRRQTEEKPGGVEDIAEPLNELDPLVAQLFQMALDRDTTGCSLQLTCAIGGRPSVALTGHAKHLLRVLSLSGTKAERDGDNWRGLDAYRTALDLGRDGGNCDQLFPNCPNSSEQLIDLFQKMRVLGN